MKTTKKIIASIGFAICLPFTALGFVWCWALTSLRYGYELGVDSAQWLLTGFRK